MLKNNKDIQETDRLLTETELDALEWLQAQIVVLTLDKSNEPPAAIGI